MRTTDVKPGDLNYDSYNKEKYDDDIVRSIPGHELMHEEICNQINLISREGEVEKALELGVGTGLTTEMILKNYPNINFTVIDFSHQMLTGAKDRLKEYNVQYVESDYSEIRFEQGYDIVISVIGMHHQSDRGKRKVFKNIYDCLGNKGVFILGDLMMFEDQEKTAINDALHFHHLVENARDEESLKERAYHHKFLNKLTTANNQIEWLYEIGFKSVKVVFEKMNTVLIVAKK